MTRPPKPSPATEKPLPPAATSDAAVQIKVWLVGISPMVWRRVRIPASCSLREFHGVIQITMGWEGIRLYQFHLRAARYGSWELSASSPDVTLAALRLRKGARFLYEYDLNTPWRHEVGIENRLEAAPGVALLFGRIKVPEGARAAYGQTAEAHPTAADGNTAPAG